MAQTINLNIIPKGIPDVVNVSQFDVGREIVFKLYDEASVYTIPTGATVIIAGRKGDNNVFAYNATILDGRHSVKVVTTNQMTACAGENLCQLRVTKSGIDLATVNFTMFVQERPDASGNVSETDIPAIVSLASEQELNAEAWAVGTKAGVPVGSGDEQYENNAKHYAEEAESWAETFTGGTTYKDAIPFASIPVSGMQNGDLYNITDSFTTDSSFSEGSGHYHEAGTNIVWNNTKSKWDVAGGIGVRSVDSILSVESTNPVQNKLITATKANALPFSVELSGNPITFNADAQAAQKLSVDLEPTQYLHGYANPWAGGMGKNYIPMTLANLKAINTSGTWNGNVYSYNGVDFTVLTNNGGNVIAIKVNGTSTAEKLYFHLGSPNLSAGTYTLNGITDGAATTYRFEYTGVTSGELYSGTKNITLSSDGVENFRFMIRVSGYVADNIMIYPMLRLSSVADATFEPYTNICPILGKTQTGVVTRGKNLAQLEQGTLSTTTGAEIESTTRVRTRFMAVEQGVNYIASSQNNGWSARNGVGYDENFNFVDSSIFPNSTTGLFVVNNPNIKYVRFIYSHSNTSETCTPSDYWYQFERGTIATAYEPYNSSSASIVFGQTIYSGHVDFKTGKVTIDKKVATFDGSDDESWQLSSNSSNNCYTITDANLDVIKVNASVVADVISNELRAISYENGYQHNNINGIAVGSSSSQFRVSLDISIVNRNLTDFKSWLASNPLEACYPLATPIEIQLTPAELELLRGYNYITADGEMELSAVPEKLINYIVNAFGTDESGRTTASRPYAAKEYFYKDGFMYKVTSAIARNAAFTEGTNCTKTTIFAELTALNA